MENEGQGLDIQIKPIVKESKTEKIVKYLTGVDLDSPELFDKLEADQKNVREKYGLPDRQSRIDDPDEYEKYLRKISEIEGIKVVEKDEYNKKYDGEFFSEDSFAGAVYDHERKLIAVDINKSDQNSYIRDLVNLEHETIHALQNKYYPEIGIEVQEYEAYVVNWGIDFLRDNPNTVAVNFDFVRNSVNHWYREENEEKGTELKAVWDSVE
ncbi:MAG: hypothetical protein WCG91_03275 [Candidatus Shapirobacteria bacterium]